MSDRTTRAVQLSLGLGVPVEEEESTGDLAFLDSYAVSEAARERWEGMQRGLPDEYREMVAGGVPWRVAVYVLWAALPSDRRVPGTQGELAVMLGLKSDRAIREWKRARPELQEFIAALQVKALVDARPRVIEALIESATTPSYRNHHDRAMALRMLGLLRDEMGLTVRQAAVEEMSEAELLEIAARGMDTNANE